MSLFAIVDSGCWAGCKQRAWRAYVRTKEERAEIDNIQRKLDRVSGTFSWVPGTTVEEEKKPKQKTQTYALPIKQSRHRNDDKPISPIAVEVAN